MTRRVSLGWAFAWFLRPSLTHSSMTLSALLYGRTPFHSTRRLSRWSWACGIEPKLQGDFCFTSNPTLHERLDRELGDKLPNYGLSLSSKLIKSWFGVDKGLMKVLNDFVAKSRKPDQDLNHLAICTNYTAADFEDGYGYTKLQKMEEKLSSRHFALFLLEECKSPNRHCKSRLIIWR